MTDNTGPSYKMSDITQLRTHPFRIDLFRSYGVTYGKKEPEYISISHWGMFET